MRVLSLEIHTLARGRRAPNETTTQSLPPSPCRISPSRPWVYVLICIYMNIHVYIYIYTHTCIQCMYVYIYIYIVVYMCICTT